MNTDLVKGFLEEKGRTAPSRESLRHLCYLLFNIRVHLCPSDREEKAPLEDGPDRAYSLPEAAGVMVKQQRQSGQGMTEYIIIVGLIAVALIVVVAYFGQRSKQTIARSGTALGGSEATEARDAAPSTGTRAAAGQGGSVASAAATTAGTSGSGGGGSSTGPGVVGSSAGGGKLDPDFKQAAKPAADTYEVKEESMVIEIQEEADSEALAAFAGKVDRRGSSGSDVLSGEGAASPGFPFGVLALILLVAVGGGFVMVFMMKRP